MDFLVQILYNSDMEKITFTMDKDMRLVDALTSKGFPFGQANKLVKNKDVRVNGEKVSTNIKVCSGSEIIAFYSGEVAPNEQQIEVVFEDQNILVVNKPDGIEVEGKAGVAERLGALAVHRLDRNTTGLLVLAKNPSAQQALLQAFRQKLVEKRYLAEVVGATNFHNQKLSAFLVKNAEESKVKIFSSPVKGGVKISNMFNTVKSSTGASVVEIELLTGKNWKFSRHFPTFSLTVLPSFHPCINSPLTVFVPQKTAKATRYLSRILQIRNRPSHGLRSM